MHAYLLPLKIFIAEMMIFCKLESIDSTEGIIISILDIHIIGKLLTSGIGRSH